MVMCDDAVSSLFLSPPVSPAAAHPAPTRSRALCTAAGQPGGPAGAAECGAAGVGAEDRGHLVEGRDLRCAHRGAAAAAVPQLAGRRSRRQRRRRQQRRRASPRHGWVGHWCWCCSGRAAAWPAAAGSAAGSAAGGQPQQPRRAAVLHVARQLLWRAGCTSTPGGSTGIHSRPTTAARRWPTLAAALTAALANQQGAACGWGVVEQRAAATSPCSSRGSGRRAARGGVIQPAAARATAEL